LASERANRSGLPRRVDAVVVGGGHAGIEAAWGLCRRGHAVALVTFDAAALARMSCNPSIGGPAKGQLAREIDALGGLMGRLIDRAGIHFRMLNRGKGPAVRAPRAQADRAAYAAEARAAMDRLSGLWLLEAEALEIVTETAPGRPPRVLGVRLGPVDWSRVLPGAAHSMGATRSPGGGEAGDPVRSEPRAAGDDAPRRAMPSPGAATRRLREPAELEARAVILTTGTFLGGKLFTGMEDRSGGRRGEPAAESLAACLLRMGLRMGRLKTGTPPRLRRDSIDWNGLVPQPGDEPPPRFSFYETSPVRNRALCHATRTNERTHGVIRGALDRSPLFGGLIRGVGPRYCPSIEDKVVRFPERESHQVFLEPEGLDSDEVYPNGVSTSLPEDVQVTFLHTLRGLEEAVVVHPGYAVEYDFLHTSQLDEALRVRPVEGLFAAGQINGTSGYEEAAAQGLIAGLQASAQLEGIAPLCLRRSDAYIGVLIDDLVTKVPEEPYRMFTSQSEYRLLLRQDNADRRLSALGLSWGLLSPEEHRRAAERWASTETERGRLRATRLTRAALRRWPPASGQARAEQRGAPLAEGDVGRSYEELLRRPAVTMDTLAKAGYRSQVSASEAATLEADIKYAGYIERLAKEIEERRALEEAVIPIELLDEPPPSLSREAMDRLRQHRPRTLGQAARLPGVGPCDVSILTIGIRRAAALALSGRTTG